jgi:hypothetical protein
MHDVQGLFEALFEQSAPVQFGFFVLHGLVIFALACGFLLFWHRRQAKPALWAPVAPFSTSITTMFALFLAFHASSIWSNKSHAERAHLEAGSAIKRLDEALGPTQLNLVEFRETLHRYVHHAAKDEWRSARNRAASERAMVAFRDLQGMTLASGNHLPGPVAAQLGFLVNQLAHARSDKLWVGANHTETTSWLVVLTLGILAHFAVASVHFERPRAGMVALALFATTTSLAYTALGIVDDPYRYLDLDPLVWITATGAPPR